MNKHFPGNLAVVLRNAPNLVRDGLKSDARAFWVLSLVSQRVKSGKEGTYSGGTQGLGLMVDIKISEISPRWPPILPKGTFTEPRWELSVVDTSSISFVVNRLYKVSPLVLLHP